MKPPVSWVMALALGCASAPRVSEADKADFDRIWRLYRSGDQSWPEERDRWLAKRGESKDILIENLLADMLRTQSIRDPSKPAPWVRPQQELAQLGDDVLAYALTTMSIRSTDEVALDRCVELLVLMKASKAVQQAYATSVAASDVDDARPKNYRKALVRAAARIDRDEGQDVLVAALKRDPSWEVRAAAVGQAGAAGAPSARVQAAVVSALADADWFVAAKAAEACARLKLMAAVPSLVDLLERATQATRLRECEVTVQALKSLTGRHDLTSSPAQWRAVLKVGG
ncbi:MAG: HEAT repeat domain-containing protein [Planctomycetota bacterium]